MSQISVSEGIGLLKTLHARHAELITLRNTNAVSERRFYGATDKEREVTPVYNIKALDKTINTLAMSARKLDNAIKKHNATTQLEGYDWNESILGEIEMA